MSSEAHGPVIILIEPQMADNIGATARAMMNCGMGELRLVRPRDGWPNPACYPAAAGADTILQHATAFPTTESATADLSSLFATTARRRGMTKRLIGPRRAGQEINGLLRGEQRPGILFGPERSGLANDDVVLADTVIEIPLNPDFHSLNLAQAVLLVAWEWRAHAERADDGALAIDATRLWSSHPPADKEELLRFFQRLEAALDEKGFLSPAHKRTIMVRNLRNLLGRARPTEQEVRTLHGVVTALAGEGAGFGKDVKEEPDA